MIFTTYWFIAFSVFVVAVYRLLPRPSWRLGFLGLGCLVFHAHFAGPAGMAPIIALMIVTYFAGLSRRRGACLAAMALSVFALCFYKYVFFIIAQAVGPWAPDTARQLADQARSIMPGAPPLGISFFAFEFVHYLYEVRNGANRSGTRSSSCSSRSSSRALSRAPSSATGSSSRRSRRAAGRTTLRSLGRAFSGSPPDS